MSPTVGEHRAPQSAATLHSDLSPHGGATELVSMFPRGDLHALFSQTKRLADACVLHGKNQLAKLIPPHTIVLGLANTDTTKQTRTTALMKHQCLRDCATGATPTPMRSPGVVSCQEEWGSNTSPNETVRNLRSGHVDLRGLVFRFDLRPSLVIRRNSVVINYSG